MVLVELNRWLLPRSAEYRPSQECPSQQSSVEDLESKVQHTDEDGCLPRQAMGEGAPGGSQHSAQRALTCTAQDSSLGPLRVSEVPMKTHVVPPSGLRDSARIMEGRERTWEGELESTLPAFNTPRHL